MAPPCGQQEENDNIYFYTVNSSLESCVANIPAATLPLKRRIHTQSRVGEGRRAGRCGSEPPCRTAGLAAQ